MTAIPVTVVTQHATHDDKSDAEYAEIFAELREQHSLAQLCTLLRSKFSRAQWNKYERGETALTRTMRNELRAAVGVIVLPPTLDEVAATINPDALVVKVGSDTPHSVILVGIAESLTIGVNGRITAQHTTEPLEARVTSVTRALRRRYHRPVASEAQEARRVALDVSWQEIIQAGLRALEETDR
jgi:hypothetical protein